jgi:hypothetical protein
MTDMLTLILDKKAALELEREKLKTRLNMIDSQVADYETTIRVVQLTVGKFDQKSTHSSQMKTAKTKQSVMPSKPNGVPTIPDMILTILEKAKEQGHTTIQPKEFLALIRDEWWPEAPAEHVAPTLWRMAKAGRLHKEGDGYSLPKKDEAPAQAEAPNNPSQDEIDTFMSQSRNAYTLHNRKEP